MLTLETHKRDTIGSGWVDRHNSASLLACGCERPIKKLLIGWAEYAESHKTRFESQVGDDSFLGPEWEQIGQSLLALLNGELGRFDGGTLDGFIRDTMEANGVDSNC